MIQITFELINGLKLGIEHLNVWEEEGDPEWMIVIDILVFRFGLIKD